jgi:hypothetical protein
LERVMGIEPVEVSREISAFGRLKDPSAMEARIFMLRGAPQGNVRQMSTVAFPLGAYRKT